MNNNNSKPIITYVNLLLEESNILKENRNKSGIYKWNNLITNKSYIGSAVNLSNRLKFYFNKNSIRRVVEKESSMIYSALLKYGYSNFSLNILEYCDKYILISREQYYIDQLKPEYNILKVAGSRLGCKHSLEVKKIISTTSRNRKILRKDNIAYHPRIVTANTKLKLSVRGQGVNVKIFDRSGNLINQFSSMKSAANYFGITYRTISRILDTGISYDEFIYKFETKDLRIWICNSDNKLIKVLNNAKNTSIYYNIPRSTLFDYIKSGKLYKHKYYFYNICSKPSYIK